MQAVAALAPRDREVLLMRHIEQLGTAEIADALGITEAGVKARLFRASHSPARPAGGEDPFMIDHDDDRPMVALEDAALAELTEEITCRLEAGEPIHSLNDREPFPAWAAPVKELLPLLQDLVEVGRIVTREQRGPASGCGSPTK